jgi:hypothetical protein
MSYLHFSILILLLFTQVNSSLICMYRQSEDGEMRANDCATTCFSFRVGNLFQRGCTNKPMLTGCNQLQGGTICFCSHNGCNLCHGTKPHPQLNISEKLLLKFVNISFYWVHVIISWLDNFGNCWKSKMEKSAFKGVHFVFNFYYSWTVLSNKK